MFHHTGKNGLVNGLLDSCYTCRNICGQLTLHCTSDITHRNNGDHEAEGSRQYETRLRKTETRSRKGWTIAACLRASQLTVKISYTNKITPESLCNWKKLFFPGSFHGNRNLWGRQIIFVTKCLRTTLWWATVVHTSHDGTERATRHTV